MARWLVLLVGPLGLSLGLRTADAHDLLHARGRLPSPEATPRQLYNAALGAEEAGQLGEACELYMASALAERRALADRLYARAGTVRLLRLVARYDSDSATAVSIVASSFDQSSADPLVAAFSGALHREDDYRMWSGTFVSARFVKRSGHLLVEIERDGGQRTIVTVDGSVRPLSPGDRVRVFVKRERGRASSSWSLVAIASEGEAAWASLRVRGLTDLPAVAARPRSVRHVADL